MSDGLVHGNVVPVIAILRGITALEVAAIADVLIACGIRAIEVPLNSPDPFTSIARLSAHCPSNCVIGAGTVLDVQSVDAAYAAGAEFIVAPNVNVAGTPRARANGMVAVPGFATATEALLAASAGATLIKLFPASSYGPNHVGALRSILPRTMQIVAVGGIGAANVSEWASSGIIGLGVGGELYRPQASPAQVRERAAHVAAAVRTAFPGGDGGLIERLRRAACSAPAPA